MNLPIQRYWALLVKYLRPQRGRALLLALLLLTNIGLSLLNPQIMRFFIDTALGGGALQTLIQAALLFLGIAITGQALNIGTNYLSEQVGWSATNALRFDLMVHCLGLDLSFHKAHTPGELIERIDGDVQKLANFFTHFMVQILGNALLMVGVNCRDLVTLQVVPGRLEQLAPSLPTTVSRVAESGVGSAEDAARVAAAGYDLALVGSALMSGPDPQALAAAMLTAARAERVGRRDA